MEQKWPNAWKLNAIVNVCPEALKKIQVSIQRNTSVLALFRVKIEDEMNKVSGKHQIPKYEKEKWKTEEEEWNKD